MSSLAVSASALSKTYRVFERPLDRLLEAVSRRPRHRDFHALRDVSFTLERGEALGLVGENGAGKSTLLKILCGITQPTAGTVETRGTVASILELGSGFHPEFTGRENAVLNAAMLGLSEQEVRERLPEILAWSELGEFVDQPVKTYSTGMAMRLGFSIATQVDPDILIIDEALSVGDGYFQKKSMDRLRALIANGTTLLFCSHAMYYISAFCRRALWLRHGEVAALGPARDVVDAYEQFLLRKGSAVSAATTEATPSAAGVAVAASSGQPALLGDIRTHAAGPGTRPGETWALDISWRTVDRELRFHVGVGINRVDGIEVAAFATHQDGLEPWRGEHEYQVRLEIPSLPLLKGDFTLYVFLLDESGLHIFDQRVLPSAVTIVNPAYRFGLVEIAHRWLRTSPPAARPAAPVGTLAAAVRSDGD